MTASRFTRNGISIAVSRSRSTSVTTTGANLAALRDRLLVDVPRPLRLIWRRSDVSRERLGDVLFARITAILDEVERQDVEFGWSDRFEYVLE